MSEQIKELVKQAGTDISGKWISVDNTEQVAELIVKECIKICEDGTSTQTTSGGAAILIKQRFGVKE